MALILHGRLADWPGASRSVYCVRCGDQSSGSTTSPFAFRLMMFIATMSGGVVSVALFVRTVLYRIGVPALTVLAVTSIDTCSCPVACAAGAACWHSARAGDAPKARREASRNKAARRRSEERRVGKECRSGGRPY